MFTFISIEIYKTFKKIIVKPKFTSYSTPIILNIIMVYQQAAF